MATSYIFQNILAMHMLSRMVKKQRTMAGVLWTWQEEELIAKIIVGEWSGKRSDGIYCEEGS